MSHLAKVASQNLSKRSLLSLNGSTNRLNSSSHSLASLASSLDFDELDVLLEDLDVAPEPNEEKQKVPESFKVVKKDDVTIIVPPKTDSTIPTATNPVAQILSLKEQTEQKVEGKQITAKSNSGNVIIVATPLNTVKNKKDCPGCNTPVSNTQPTLIIDHVAWHTEHFICTTCKKPLSLTSYNKDKGEYFCDADYNSRFSDICNFCNKPIRDKFITAMNQTWHTDHFFCSQCGQTFPDGVFIEHDGKAYCEEDYKLLFAQKCIKCALVIESDKIFALESYWHAKCFVCTECGVDFENGNFCQFQDQPYCEMHYYKATNMWCSTCDKAITGKCMTTISGKRYHLDHFTCCYCSKQLGKTDFKEYGDKPYCKTCHSKLYG